MNQLKKFWSVNWQDGMLVSAEHLTMDQQHLEHVSRRILRTLMMDYGLAWDPAEPTPDASLKWEARMVDTNTVEVEVYSCRAITRDGSFVAIFEESGDEIPSYIARKSLPDSSRTKLGVYVLVKPGEYHEIGIEDPDEEPPRALYRIPKYEVRIAGTKIVESNSLKIGEIFLQEGRVRKRNQIPPCLNMQCDAKQIQAARLYERQLNTLMEYAMEFYSRLMSNTGPVGVLDPGTDLARSLATISAHLAIFIGESIDRYSNSIIYGSPREFIIYFKELFRRFDISMSSLGQHGRQDVYHLWAKHCEQVFQQNTFEENMRKVLNTPFEPGSVLWFIVVITELMKVLLQVFKILLDRPWGSWEDQSAEPQKRSVFLWDIHSGKDRSKAEFRTHQPQDDSEGDPL